MSSQDTSFDYRFLSCDSCQSSPETSREQLKKYEQNPDLNTCCALGHDASCRLFPSIQSVSGVQLGLNTTGVTSSPLVRGEKYSLNVLQGCRNRETKCEEKPNQIPVTFHETKNIDSEKASRHIYSLGTKEVLRLLGPGWLVAMAYIDPGNLEGDIVAGGVRDGADPQAGYRLLWVLLLSTLVGCIFQHLAIRLGVHSGKDLAQICRQFFPRWFVWILWLNMEISLLGADIQSVIGSSLSLHLLFHIPYNIAILLTLVDSGLLLLVDLWGVKFLEAFFALFISFMSGCFYINMFKSSPNIGYIFNGLTSFTCPHKSLPVAISLVGSVIMPHNFFLQSVVVQSRPLNRHVSSLAHYVISVYTLEIMILLLISLSVNFAVVVSFASPPFISPNPLNLSNAHLALQSALGENSAWVWAIGLLASSQCATVASTYAGQFLMEGLLGLQFKNLASRLVVTRLLSLTPLFFLLTASTVTIETIASVINILQAMHLPFILILLIRLTSTPHVVGKEGVISPTLKGVCYTAAFLLILANTVLSITQLAHTSCFLSSLFLFFYFTSMIYVGFHHFQEGEEEKELPPHSFDTKVSLL